MMKFLIFLVIFASVNIEIVKSDSGFVTLWTPKFVQEDAPFRLFILPTDLNRRTEVAVQFRKSSAAVILTDGKVSTIEYPSKERHFGKKKEFDLSMTLYRNMSTVSGTQMHCSTRNIAVKASTGNFYNFIQTDKPIYKPGDVVQFRILTVDKNLKPFHRNSIEVNITDPFGNILDSQTDQTRKFVGVFDSNFTLGNATTLGDWKITVVVDNKTYMATSKIFAVQKYTLPLFDTYIDIPELHVLQQRDITFSIYGKYSFGEFVSGNAEIIIRNPENEREYLNTNITGIKAPHIVKYNLKNLGIQTFDEMKLEVFVKITEPESKIAFNRTANFYVHHEQRRKLVVEHAEKFLPGFPFAMKMYVNDWKGNRIMQHFEEFVVFYYYKLKNGTKGDIEGTGKINNGVFGSEYKIPNEYVELKIHVEFPGSNSYSKNIEMGSVNVGINSLLVKHSPEEPKLNDKVKIFVTSDTELQDVLMAVVTRFGIIENRQISCHQKILCEFEVKITENMMPTSKIMVYDVKGVNLIFQGQTEIKTEDIGRNEIKLELPSEPVNTRQDVKMKFTTKPRSTIYLLAFDKRLKSLRDGNDIIKKDVTDAIDFDGENQFIANDMTQWSVCTPEEIERVEKGRRYIVKHTGDKVVPRVPEEKSNEDVDWNDKEPEKEDKTKDDLLREYFPETWIFETLQVGKDKSLEKVFKTPDAITTWLVSAYSVHKDAGFALAPAQELIVKNEFFMKMDLPYSIRYKEVLKLKIMIFNYVKTNEELRVNFKMMNENSTQFEYVEYHDCEPTYKNEDQVFATAVLTVPPGEVKTITIYIRSHQTTVEKPTIDERMLIRVKATGTDKSGNVYNDNLKKSLKVEPVGVRNIRATTMLHNLNNTKIVNPVYIKDTNFSGALAGIDVLVSGDFITKTTKLKKFETFTTYCLEQRTSKLKRYVDTFRYLKALNKEMSTNTAKELYQNILKALQEKYEYTNDPWYRSYLGNVLAMAMESGALPMDRQAIIETLKLVEEPQHSNGTFSNFVFYYGFPGEKGTKEYMASIQYFSAAYCLIPFLKHRELLGTQFDTFISRGIRFLKSANNQKDCNSLAFSTAAYALALKGEDDEAKKLIGLLDSVKYHQQNIKCYRTDDKDEDCNARVTTYVALALIKLDMITEAEPIVHWLVTFNDEVHSNTGLNALVTEPIAELALKIRSDDTNLNVIIKDERSFKKQVTIKEFNSHIQQYVPLPKYSEKASYEIYGKGYCSISIITERIVTVPQIASQFNITMDTDIDHNVKSQKVLKLCAIYLPEDKSKNVVVNVIYEIDMPSGYTFDSIKNAIKLTEIKHIQPEKEGTLIHVYYNNFYANTDYCIEVVANRKFVVNEAADAGVKVYDFDFKESAAIDFYRFDSPEC